MGALGQKSQVGSIGDDAAGELEPQQLLQGLQKPHGGCCLRPCTPHMQQTCLPSIRIALVVNSGDIASPGSECVIKGLQLM